MGNPQQQTPFEVSNLKAFHGHVLHRHCFISWHLILLLGNCMPSIVQLELDSSSHSPLHSPSRPRRLIWGFPSQHAGALLQHSRY